MRHYEPSEEAKEAYYEALEDWEASKEKHFADDWKSFIDTYDTAEYFSLNGNDPEKASDAAEAMMQAADIKDCEKFIKWFCEENGTEYDEDRMREIVMSNHEDEMRDCWEEDNPKPLSPEEGYDAYCEEQWEDSRL